MNATNVQQMFSGNCLKTNRNGNKVTASCKMGAAVFETQLPLLVRGVSCPHLRGSVGDGSHLISQGCTGPDAIMKRAAWKCTGLVANPINNGFPYQLALSSLTGVGASAIAALAGTGVFVNWFAFGWVEIGAGANIQRRAIVGSTVIVGGAITLSLHRYLSTLPTLGATVTIYPGCDGQYATCQSYNAATNPTGKFGNQNNFGGDPFTPTGNPSVTGQPNVGVQGGKK
jgi:hypothetical protein